MKIKAIILSISFIFLRPLLTYSAYHDVLPKGTRLIGIKQLLTNKVDGFYGPTSNNRMYDMDFDINANVLNKVEE